VPCRAELGAVLANDKVKFAIFPFLFILLISHKLMVRDGEREDITPAG
jgi:hypothetical protein